MRGVSGMVGLEIKSVISTNLLITSVEIQPQAVEGTAQPGRLAKELTAGDDANTHARRSPACSPTVRWLHHGSVNRGGRPSTAGGGPPGPSSSAADSGRLLAAEGAFMPRRHRAL